ncbi:hypothetical protein MASR1M74_01030 [Lentimicrobium sp.]
MEYYFKGEGKYLTFPWDKGFSADEMEAYYDEVQHVDWVHKLSRAPMLKTQHPDYEIYMTGVHADRGVSCADCHMPYKRDGGMKFTDHKIQSPLANVSGSCQVCHRESEAKLIANVVERQEKVIELRRIAKKIWPATMLKPKWPGTMVQLNRKWLPCCNLFVMPNGVGTGLLQPMVSVSTLP